MAYLTYPNLANTGGLPLLEGTAAVSGGNLVITFQPHAALGEAWTGGFYVKISNAIATGSQPVVFATQGQNGTYPLVGFNGAQLTAAQLVTSGGGVIIAFYDASNKRLSALTKNGPTT